MDFRWELLVTIFPILWSGFFNHTGTYIVFATSGVGIWLNTSAHEDFHKLDT